MTYEPIIGLEIHVELKTKSKMFCGCKNDPFFAPKPNIYTCPVCLGLPGGLPVPNKKAVEWTIMLGLALGCTVNLESKFDRKHYFYPDLPKGYQISQHDIPLCRNGVIHLPSRDVRIHRVHLEEDTGKLLHATIDGKRATLVDFNRSGVPLLEIVTEPDIRSADEAKEFLKKLHHIIRWLDISDADMEKGSMRLEPNISVRNVPSKTLLPPYKVEVKNINSFRFVKKAIDYEVNRHIRLLEEGQLPLQETRGWDEKKGITFSQRHKEHADDYRYFPEPDIPLMRFTEAEISNLKFYIPELPDAKKARFVQEYGLSDIEAAQMTETVARANYFESAVRAAENGEFTKIPVTPKLVANWIINRKIEESMEPAQLIAEIAKSQAVEEVSDDVVQTAIGTVFAANPKAVADFRAGKEKVKMFLFGNVLRELKGKGNKRRIMGLLEQRLAS